MDRTELYRDIAERTNGDIYIGVVGPVRTGKSTFIKRFMDLLVLPGMEDPHAKERLTDELPQSAAGRTIMTTQPKFVPNEAAQLKISDTTSIRVRMVDCVGYMVPGAVGHIENDMPRMVRTPWHDHDIPFEEAAEIGTRKVITEHSTIGVVLTTDGSITQIGREDYVEAEERVIRELKEQGKPFVIVLNSTHPNNAETLALAMAMQIPDKDDTRTTAEGLARVLSRAKRSWPALPARAFITTYAGVRAHAETDDFILGEPADAPLFFNALGVESPGLSAAPALGEFLAQSVAERLGAAPNPAFDPIRPGIPKFRDMTDAEREAAIARDPEYAKIVCRCELVTEAEIRASIRRPVGARTVDGIKRRTRAGMGRCQAGFCLPRTLELLAEELAASPLSITKCGGESRYLESNLFSGKAGE